MTNLNSCLLSLSERSQQNLSTFYLPYMQFSKNFTHLRHDRGEKKPSECKSAEYLFSIDNEWPLATKLLTRSYKTKGASEEMV